MSKKVVVLATLLLNLVMIQNSSAVDYHVSVNGNDSTGNGSEASPWRTPEFGAKQLASGDSLIIHAGTYVLSASNLPAGQREMNRYRALVSPPSNLNGTPSAPILIRSAGDGEVLLDAGQNPSWPAVGTNLGDYVEINGLSVRGAAILWSSTGSIITNCNLYGGIDTPTSNGGDNFGVVLRVENCTNCEVKNNRLHDNQLGVTIENSPLLIEYDSTNLVIENNDFFNSIGLGIRLKDNPNQVHIRYNHFYNNYHSAIQGANQDTGQDVHIYHNLIRNNNTSGSQSYGGISQLTHINGWRIYNNTFIDNGNADIRTLYSLEISDIQAWNNLHDNSVSSFYHIGWSSSGALFESEWTYSNFNNFYGSANWRERSQTWSSVSAFSQDKNLDSNSISTNPGFVNRNGNQAKDFKRTTYPQNGRGEGFNQVIGAYVTGDENIGYVGKTPKAPPSADVD